MIRYRCDGCGADLAPDGSGHYVVQIEAFAAAGRLEFTSEDLERDHEKEIARLLTQLRARSMDEIEDEVYRRLRYDLCSECHRKFLKDPLERVKRGHESKK